MLNNVNYDIDITKEPPADDTARQYYFIEKAKAYVQRESEELGRPLTFCVTTFGCQMNARDSEKLCGILEKIGYVEAAEDEADFIIFNTCTVRENANMRVYGRLGQLKPRKKKNPHMMIGLCGCMMQEPEVVEKLKTSYRYVELLFGKAAMEKLENSRVAVFGIGGVGGYVCEALVRSGVGHFDLIDDDKVCLTNLNRQIIATRKTIGQYKTDVMKERMLEINPKVDVTVHKCFFLPETAEEFHFDQYDYVVDAVDTVTAKISLVMKAQEAGTPIISSMGAGNKLDASRFQVADIYKTKVCPLAKVMRRELKKRGVRKLKVVYSDELPTRPINDMAISCRTNCICPPGAQHKCTERRDIPGSTAFVPSVAGLIIAGEVIKDLTRDVRVTAESVENQQ